MVFAAKKGVLLVNSKELAPQRCLSKSRGKRWRHGFVAESLQRLELFLGTPVITTTQSCCITLALASNPCYVTSRVLAHQVRLTTNTLETLAIHQMPTYVATSCLHAIYNKQTSRHMITFHWPHL